MLNRRSLSLCLVLVLACASGCHRPQPGPGPNPGPGPGPGPGPNPGPDITAIVAAADLAGGVSASIFVAAANPPQKEVEAISFVLTAISNATSGYPTGGFISMTAAINAQIDVQLPPATNAVDNALCKQLAQVALTELDNLFNLYPEWKTQGSEAAQIVTAFTNGAFQSLSVFKTNGKIPPAPQRAKAVR